MAGQNDRSRESLAGHGTTARFGRTLSVDRPLFRAWHVVPYHRNQGIAPTLINKFCDRLIGRYLLESGRRIQVHISLFYIYLYNLII